MDDFSWITVLTATVPAVLVLLINEIAHTVRHKRALNNQLAQVFIPQRIKTAEEILGAIAQRFYDLQVNKVPAETCETVDKLIEDLRRVRLANAALIGEELEGAIDVFVEVLEDFREFITVRFIETEKEPVDWAEYVLGLIRAVTIDIANERIGLYLARDTLEKTVRKYAGFDIVDEAIKKAGRPGLCKRIRAYIQKLKQHPGGKKADKEAGGDGKG